MLELIQLPQLSSQAFEVGISYYIVQIVSTGILTQLPGALHI